MNFILPQVYKFTDVETFLSMCKWEIQFDYKKYMQPFAAETMKGCVKFLELNWIYPIYK